MKKFSKVLVFVLAFISFATLESKAQTNRVATGRCSISLLFGMCSADCSGYGQTAKCSGILFPSCSCEGGLYLNKVIPKQENINEFAGLISSFESVQSKESKELFVKTLELMKGTDGKTYSEGAANFERSLDNLPKSEKAVVDAWISKKSGK